VRDAPWGIVDDWPIAALARARQQPISFPAGRGFPLAFGAEISDAAKPALPLVIVAKGNSIDRLGFFQVIAAKLAFHALQIITVTFLDNPYP